MSRNICRAPHVRELERYLTAMAHHLGADLDQLLLVSDYRFTAPAIAMVRMKLPTFVGQQMQLKADGVGGEETARQRRSRIYLHLSWSIYCSGVPR
jgi:hypothetical protein